MWLPSHHAGLRSRRASRGRASCGPGLGHGRCISESSMRPDRRELSIVVPVYNEAENIGPLVEAVRAALGDDLAWELLLVDDGSSDGSRTVARALGRADRRVRLIPLARNFGQVLVVHPSVPARSVKELLALAKARPGGMNYASAGIGNILYIAAEMMKSMTGVNIVDIQYKGAGPAFNDLLGGHVDMCFAPTQTALPLIQAGRLRALAMTGPSRWKVLPDVPTMRESGLKDYELVGWFGMWMPAGVAPELVARIFTETARALGEPDVKQRFDELGLEPVGSQPEAFAKFIVKDAAEMRELARKIGLAAK